MCERGWPLRAGVTKSNIRANKGHNSLGNIMNLAGCTVSFFFNFLTPHSLIYFGGKLAGPPLFPQKKNCIDTIFTSLTFFSSNLFNHGLTRCIFWTIASIVMPGEFSSGHFPFMMSPTYSSLDFVSCRLLVI